MNAPLPAWYAFISLLVIMAYMIYIFRNEFKDPNAMRAIMSMALAIVLLVGYVTLSPYYVVMKNGTISVPYNYTTSTVTVSNGTTSTITYTVTATKVIPQYTVSPTANSYMMFIIMLSIILVLVSFYFFIRSMMKMRFVR